MGALRFQFARFLFLVLATASAHAAVFDDTAHLPKPFLFRGRQAVFGDFDAADYDITYDLALHRVTVVSRIRFRTVSDGYPVFDCVENPAEIRLDGQRVAASLESTPDRETLVRVVDRAVPAGQHSFEIVSPITRLIDFSNPKGVKSAFWMTDLTDRSYLERYLPANLIFDRVEMIFHLHFIGSNGSQIIYTNGLVTRQDSGNFEIRYPPYFTASSIFFHTTFEGSTREVRFNIRSMDGREIPAVLYTAADASGPDLDLEKNQLSITSIIQKLESNFGPFPHSSLTVYLAPGGGMEYCGATMSSEAALNHELFHSYVARGVMPANGNAGWIDEALAVWWTSGMPAVESLTGSSMMSNHPYYTRTTDRDGYGFGEKFMAFLNYRFAQQGGLALFLREFILNHHFEAYAVDEFSSRMGLFYGSSVEADFQKYTYGSSSTPGPAKDFFPEAVEYHQYSLRELERLL